MGDALRYSVLILILPFFFSANSYCQKIEAGLGLLYGVEGSTTTSGPGASLVVSYDPLDFLDLRTTWQVFISDFKGIKPYVGGDNYTLVSIEESVIYYPIKFDIAPYFGLGIGYYNIQHSTPGMSYSYQGYTTTNYFQDNKIGAHIVFGAYLHSLAEISGLSFRFDFKYLFLEQHLNAYWRDINISKNINLNKVFAGIILSYYFQL